MKKLTYILFAALILLNTLFLCGCNNGVSKDTSLSENNRFAEGYYVNFSQEPFVSAFDKGIDVLSEYYNVPCSYNWSEEWTGKYAPDTSLGEQEIPLTLTLTLHHDSGNESTVMYLFYNSIDNIICSVSGYMEEGTGVYELDRNGTDQFIMFVLQAEIQMYNLK